MITPHALIYLAGDRRYRHLRHSPSGNLLALLFSPSGRAQAESTRPLSFGTTPRKDEGRQSLEEICSAYLQAYDAHKAEPTTETEIALIDAKVPLLGRLKASPRKRLTALGCVFHLHWDGQAPGISAHRKLAKSRTVPPALIRSF